MVRPKDRSSDREERKTALEIGMRVCLDRRAAKEGGNIRRLCLL